MERNPKHEPGRSGRPRSERLHRAILDAALDLVTEVGFRSVSVETIAAKAGVGKTTVYRRWPNKAAVVMDAFMLQMGSTTLFPQEGPLGERIRLQMRTMARAFGGARGTLVKALLAEAQFDSELAQAFHDRWTVPRRQMALKVFEEAVDQGVLRSDIDLDAVIDILYAPIYYRLQMGLEPLSDTYIDTIYGHVMDGLHGS